MKLAASAFTLFTVMVPVSLLPAAAHAEVTATQTVMKEVVENDASGKQVITRVKAEKVTPGEEVIYRLDYSNSGPDAAENVKLVMPVPDVIDYIEGSITGSEIAAAFSADGGATFVARGRLLVDENGEQRPAKSADITHIQWVIPSLEVGKSGSVSYRGILK
ncbi:MAG: hypothetical protein AAFR21_05085 [Pseudomonadota bacterium]